RVTVRNYANRSRRYAISSQFRYVADVASGAVTVDAPPGVLVPANGSAQFDFRLRVKASKLPIWKLNGGSLGGAGSSLEGVEFDGYLTLTESSDTVHLPWQILPHRAADVEVLTDNLQLDREGKGTLILRNIGGAVDGRVDVFSLTGTSPRIKKKFLPGPGDNFAIIDLRSVGARGPWPDAGYPVQLHRGRLRQLFHGRADGLDRRDGLYCPPAEVRGRWRAGFRCAGRRRQPAAGRGSARRRRGLAVSNRPLADVPRWEERPGSRCDRCHCPIRPSEVNPEWPAAEP